MKMDRREAELAALPDLAMRQASRAAGVEPITYISLQATPSS